MTECLESVYGIHQLSDKQGRCLLCHKKIDSAHWFNPDTSKRYQARKAQDPLSIDGPDEGDYLDGFE